MRECERILHFCPTKFLRRGPVLRIIHRGLRVPRVVDDGDGLQREARVRPRVAANAALRHVDAAGGGVLEAHAPRHRVDEVRLARGVEEVERAPLLKPRTERVLV